jgi:bifunctional ADP-heptose synthase (sugar kinase/adenylyltransferase)
MSKVLVIGDSCTDVFVYGDIERVCPEAPVPVFNPIKQTENGGMAKNVVANLEALGVKVDVITNTNDIKKRRYVDNRSGQMVLRVDEHDYCKPVDRKYVNTFVCGKKYDAVIFSDYNKGFLTKEDIRFFTCIEEIWDVPTFLDTKKFLGNWCEHFDFPELKEKLIVTLGKNGCSYREKVYPTQEVPVKDVSGAGDTFLAGLVFQYIKNHDIEESIEFAQKCTTEVVQKHGVATI